MLLPVVTACSGGGLDARVAAPMDACVLQRNPVFVAGNGATALDTPLPASVDSMMQELRYKAAFERFQQIAEEAPTQAVLVCALELGARYNERASVQWLKGYTRHPNEPVAAAAQRLIERPFGR
jgi:hypothetical protein